MNIKHLLIGSAAALAAVSLAHSAIAAAPGNACSLNFPDLVASSEASPAPAVTSLEQPQPKIDKLALGPNATGTGGGPNELASADPFELKAPNGGGSFMAHFPQGGLI